MPDIIYIDLLDAFNKSRLTSHMYMYLDIAKTNPISSHSEYAMNPQSIRAVDRMWILKVCWSTYNEELSSCNTSTTFDLSTLYNTIPHSKYRLRNSLIFNS